MESSEAVAIQLVSGVLLSPFDMCHIESLASLRINSLMGYMIGTHIRLPNHKVPWLSSEKSLVLLS
jgi:hypothetical protein